MLSLVTEAAHESADADLELDVLVKKHQDLKASYDANVKDLVTAQDQVRQLQRQVDDLKQQLKDKCAASRRQ